MTDEITIVFEESEGLRFVASVEEPVGVRYATLAERGPQGIPGVAASFTYTKDIAESVWTVTHNLNKKPSVMVVNSADTIIYGVVQYINVNSITVTFTEPVSGKVYCT